MSPCSIDLLNQLLEEIFVFKLKTLNIKIVAISSSVYNKILCKMLEFKLALVALTG